MGFILCPEGCQSCGGRCSQENALAFEENRLESPAQPGFAAGIAEKPPHPAKGAGDTGSYEIEQRRHSLGNPNSIIWLMMRLRKDVATVKPL
jgi:hypothetical protein